MEIERYLIEMKELVDEALDRYLPQDNEFPSIIYESMRYSLFAGGKRVRPILIIASAETIGGRREDVLPFAAGVEMIHTYTLIHDDLPALDNDDLRRGKLTNHKVFGEAIAILAGDALLTYAFQLMTDHNLMSTIPPSVLLSAVNEMAMAVGSLGTIGGQVVDIQSEGKEVDMTTIEYIHAHKTGSLIMASIKCGAILSEGSSDERDALISYGKDIGLAFQIIDDILDLEGDEKRLGKAIGSDIENKKVTYPALFGVEESRRMANRLVEDGISSLKIFGSKADVLRDIANFFISRNF
ncbi:MAG: polyprenyl synthetase family protein [Nitrospinae bacterium]|nr:polyprenyl synthetase family protein [Nitrospinota bacterium]